MADNDNKLSPGEKMVPGESISSNNGEYDLKMQHDGNLVLYRDSDDEALWASGVTFGKAVSEVVMQHDGNLVIYGYENHNALWASNTNDHGHNSYLAVQNDGNVVIYDSFYAPDKAIWDTGTWMY
jgi:hypothetical protein